MRYIQLRWAAAFATLVSLCAVGHAESADQQLWDAITSGNVTEAQDAIRGGALVKNVERDLLSVAASARHADCVALLLDSGADAHGSSVLLSAVANPEIPLGLIERLFQAGAPLDTHAAPASLYGAPSGGVVLQALRAQRVDVAMWLLDHGAPVNLAGSEGVTELMSVAQREVVDDRELVPVVKRLLAVGADPARRDNTGKSAADYAAERGYVQIILLLEPAKSTRDLTAVKRRGQEHALATVLRLHASSRIQWAKLPPSPQPANQLEVIDRLLRAGANPNAQVKSWFGTRSILELALIAESSPPMWHADPKVVALLLEHGARWASCGDRLPAVVFELAGHADILALALQHGLSPTASAQQQGLDLKLQATKTSMSLLHAAAAHGAVDSIKLLIARHLSLTTGDDAGYTPLMRAISSGRDAAVSALIDAGAPIANSPNGPTLADLAAKAGLINRLREWDHNGTYRLLTEQYPPQPTSRWAGEWEMGQAEGRTLVTFGRDGMGSIWGQPFAWCETDDGVRIRMVQRNPKIPQLTVAQEFILTGSPDAEMRSTGTSTNSPIGVGLWTLHRPGHSILQSRAVAATPPSESAATEIAAQLAGLKSGRSTALFLDGRGLATLPSDLLETQGWTQADIYWSNLKQLPKEFARLSTLTKVTIANQDSLTVEPGSLALPNVTRLEIRHSRLMMLPLRFSDIPNLIELQLFDNRLSELPGRWADARALTHVVVAGNRLRRLPDDIGAAPRLHSINADDNQLTDLPKSLATSSLQELWIDNNRLGKVPDVVGQCRRLTSLNLVRNGLSTIPESVLGLPELTDLDLSSNRLEQVPNLSRARRLKRVSLRSNRLAVLPETDDWLPASVVELDLAGNPFSHVPAWLHQRAFSRLLLTGTGIPDSEARQLEREAEQRWQARPR